NTDVFAPTDLFKNAGGYEKYKFLSDLLLRQVANQEGLPLIVVNPSTVVGPGWQPLAWGPRQFDGFYHQEGASPLTFPKNQTAKGDRRV
ncbi:SDR family oxidoreductase, partial [Stenotrophomonas maltophilia]|nr:SDR family oxidoreductase [Stenotrophomonas maltophilia]